MLSDWPDHWTTIIKSEAFVVQEQVRDSEIAVIKPQGSQTVPIEGHFLPFTVSLWQKVAYNRSFLSVHGSHLSCYNNTRGYFTYLEVCCYGIDLGASIVMFHQSEHSIWTDLDQ